MKNTLIYTTLKIFRVMIVKYQKGLHNKETPKANDILDVIHSNIIGPINESNKGIKYNYFH